MAVAIRKRLEDKKDEVLKFVELYGVWKGMDEYKVRDYPAFSKWLRENTGDPNFGLHPKHDLQNHSTLGEQLVQAFLSKVAGLEAKNQKLNERVKLLEFELRGHEGNDFDIARAVLESCKV